MQTIERPNNEQPTIQALEVENKLLRRQVEKLAEENTELLKKVVALQTAARSHEGRKQPK